MCSCLKFSISSSKLDHLSSIRPRGGAVGTSTLFAVQHKLNVSALAKPRTMAITIPTIFLI
ncbi:hypothetical protein BpHYR1_052753 [Brachionus plicatilis]|uniref:Uncharacterized protein n=1 Tax=Brachionus plicatilis TaxID=10195 RepID=A0A3M7QK86_BRAPC|nr:hypothetical protein BpHYR1_052753 [Brachionus plicatilis]